MSETKQITIQVSASIYWGYQYKVQSDLVYAGNENNLIDYLKRSMKKFFKSHNMEELAEGVDKLDLHLHLPENDIPHIVYACDHPHD